jgi:CheY-like chemotaxis protein
MTNPRVLFVDDEPRILDGLRRSLRGKRTEWDMTFATSAAEALEILAESPHDVVISDMRMPGMDGAELLTLVSKRHPEVARVVLSGHTEPEAAIKVAVAGHRFLTKPSDVSSVVAAIDQLLVTTSPGQPTAVRRIAGAVRSLPTLPGHVEPLRALLRAGDVDYPGAVRATAHNISLAAKLLQLSNSAFFGARARAVSVESVVNAIGLPTIQALVDAGQVLWTPSTWGPAVESRLHASWRHSVATARLVARIASPANQPYAQAAALLQDVGRFAVLTETGERPDTANDPGADDCGGIPLRDIGVELLHLWGLPVPIVTAVSQRDAEHRPAPAGLGVAGAVRASHLLLQYTEARDPAAGTHDDELALLLAHPQVQTRGLDWRVEAEAASERASQWFTG